MTGDAAEPPLECSAMCPPRWLLLLALCLAACGRGSSPPTEIRVLESPAGAGASLPRLTASPEGEIWLSWVEPQQAGGHALRFSVLGDLAWQPARTVAAGDDWFVNWADFPSVVPLDASRAAAHWLVKRSGSAYAYDVVLSLSTDRGLTWGAPIIPHGDDTVTEHGFVSLFPDAGGLGMLWLDGRQMVNEYDENDKGASGMTLRSGTFDQDLLPFKEAQVDDLVCDCCQTDIAITEDGPIAVYRNRTVNEIRDIYVSRREFDEWQSGHAISEDNWEIAACPVNGPVIQANGSRIAVAWFTAADDKARVRVAWSDDSGRTFSDAMEVTADHPLGRVGAVLLTDGDIVVSWLKSTGDGGAQLLMNRVSPGRVRGDAFVLAEAANVFAFSVPQLALKGSDLVVAWTTEIDRIYGVRSAIVPLSQLDHSGQ